MTTERKKRFYPKRGDYVVEAMPLAYEAVSRGRQSIDDSKWIEIAVEGLKNGAYKNRHNAAFEVANMIDGSAKDKNRNQSRIYEKLRRIKIAIHRRS